MKIKNITKQELTVPGVGVVQPGEIVEAPEDFHNINFVKLEEKKEENVEEKTKETTNKK